MPVNSENSPCSLFVDSGHLEREYLLNGRSGFLQLLLDRVKHVGVLEELAAESSEYKNLIIIHLGNSKSLSPCEALACVLDCLPVLLSLVIVPFNSVHILLGRIRYATEHIHKLILETATSMVMSSFVQGRYLKPNVEVYIVLFTFLMSVVGLFSRTSHDYELLAEGAR